MIDLLRIAAIRVIVSWWQDRPTQRRLDRLKARRVELKARIEIESRQHRRVSHLYAQLQTATSELLRLERRRIA